MRMAFGGNSRLRDGGARRLGKSEVRDCVMDLQGRGLAWVSSRCSCGDTSEIVGLASRSSGSGVMGSREGKRSSGS